jgi:hypothetical protein
LCSVGAIDTKFPGWKPAVVHFALTSLHKGDMLIVARQHQMVKSITSPLGLLALSQ